MTNEELKEELKSLGFSLKSFADLTSISYSTVAKWGNATPVPPWVPSYIELLKERRLLQKFKTTIIELAENLKK